MSLPTIAHSDSENDDANEENATQPLLLQSASSSTPTTTIKLPTLAQSNKYDTDNRVLSKFGQLANIKFNRIDYRRSHRDKWSRINIGIFTISFFSVVYFCVSMNLNVDKPMPQMIVDVPPVDEHLLGRKGKKKILIFPCFTTNLLIYYELDVIFD